MGIVVGIDASRNRSGGAIAHLVGILGASYPPGYDVSEVHVWSYKALLDALPDVSWLIKHNPPELERSLFRQAWWQFRHMPEEVRRHNCNILLSTDAGTVGRYRPSVVMSRDMLSYEPGEMQRYGLSKARVRLVLLRYIQSRSMKRADGVIFLTKHAAETIQAVIGKLPRVSIIPHGVGAAFKRTASRAAWTGVLDRTIRCLYVSNAAMYKHQWEVVRAVGKLRERGYDVTLQLAGGGTGRAQRLLEDELARTDPQGKFVELVGFVRHEKLPELMAQSDIFIFASSCENMPNTLVEAMAMGLPIACSDRGPMPEILEDGGVYFDPENSATISAAVEKIMIDGSLRATIIKRASELSAQYSWTRCAAETWDYLTTTFRDC